MNDNKILFRKTEEKRNHTSSLPNFRIYDPVIDWLFGLKIMIKYMTSEVEKKI